MPQVASTAPTAKARILTLLNARTALNTDKVKRTWGGPTEGEDVANEHIFLGDTNVDGEWKALGAGRRDENYTIALTVAVRKYGDNEQATEERAWTLLNEVSAALESDTYLAGLLYVPASLLNVRQTNVPVGPQQWGCQLAAQITCTARFTP